jgi:CBS domain-containing protein
MTAVKEIMTPEPITVQPDTDILKAAKILIEKRINGLPVVDDQKRLVGILSQSDLIVQQQKLPLPSVFTLLDGMIPLSPPKEIERQLQKMAATRVDEAMTRNVVTVTLDSRVEDVATIMVDKKIHTLPVVDRYGRLVGVVGKEDVLKTLMPGAEGA